MVITYHSPSPARADEHDSTAGTYMDLSNLRNLSLDRALVGQKCAVEENPIETCARAADKSASD
jgi:hypothetical protein